MTNSLLYSEIWANGVKVDSVKKGDAIEYRVVFHIDAPSNVKIVIQRRNSKTYPQINSGDRSYPTAGDWYIGFTWGETEAAGTYYIKTSMFTNGVQTDWKEFPYIVTGTNGGNGGGGNWWDIFNVIPGGIYTVTAIGIGTTIAIIAGVMLTQKKRRS